MRFFVLISLTILTACMPGGYGSFYNPIMTSVPADQWDAPTGNVQVYQLTNPERDGEMLARKGYELIGYSSFNGKLEGNTAAIAQARKVGADIVLIKSTHTGTTTSSVPLTMPTTTTTITNDSGNVSGSVYGNYGYTPYSGNYSGDYSGTSTSTTYGSQTTYIPVTVSRYDQFAAFFAKRKYILGVRADDMVDDLKNATGLSGGAFVRYVVEDTPAAHAGIIDDDIITSLNGVKINSVRDLESALKANQGKPALVSILRRGGEKLGLIVYLK